MPRYSDNDNQIEGGGDEEKGFSLAAQKWLIFLLDAIAEQSLRFDELSRSIGGFSEEELSIALSDLERDGLVARSASSSSMPEVYELSARGRSLREVLQPVGKWVRDHAREIQGARARFDQDDK